MAAASKDDLAALHDKVAKFLTKKIDDETATGADIANALKLLKDSNMNADFSNSKPLQGLAAVLPFSAEGIRHKG